MSLISRGPLYSDTIAGLYSTPDLQPNPSSDSNSSDSSCSSGPELITPRTSLSTTSPININRYTDSSPADILREGPNAIGIHGKQVDMARMTSRRTLKPKASFSSWTSSFRSSAIMQFRTSQEEPGARDLNVEDNGPQSGKNTQMPPFASGQFDDAQTTPVSSSSRSSSTNTSAPSSAQPATPSRSSSPMRIDPSADSTGSQGSASSGRGSTRKLISGLKKLGVTLRPASFDRKGVLRVPSSGTATPPIPPSLANAPVPLRVSYTLASAAAGRNGAPSGGAPISFAAFLPPERLEWHERRKEEEEGRATLRASRVSQIRTDIGGFAYDVGDRQSEERGDEEDRGLFSPPPPESPVMTGIQGTLDSVSPVHLPVPKSAITPSLAQIDTSGSTYTSTETRPAYPTPVLPPTSCPSPIDRSPLASPSKSNSSPHDQAKRNVGTGMRSAPASRLFTPFESSVSREVGLSLPGSTSASQTTGLVKISTLNSGHTANRGRCVSFTSQAHPSSSSTTARKSPNSSPRHISSGLPTSHSAQNLSYTHIGPLSTSGLSRHSSLRRPSNLPRGSPTSHTPAFTLIRQSSRTSLRQWAQPSPTPPSLIITPKTLEPPIHAVSPVVGTCPCEPNPVSDGREPEVKLAGRPRTKSGRWRSPTGLFELGGLGLGDVRGGSTGSISESAREGQKGEEGEKYEHVDTPGEFGLGGSDKVKQAEENGDNPYFV